MKTHKYKWSRDQIRAARHALLPQILEREGLALRPTGAGNFKLPEHPEMIIKDCYWRSSRSEESGNTIDFLVKVRGMSFDQAMATIMKRT
jgi:hypothetical protein